MDQMLAEALRVVKLTFGYTDQTLELVALACLAAIIFVLVLARTSDMLGAEAASRARSAIVLVFSLIVILAAVVTVDIYVAPRIADPSVRKFLPIVTAVCLLFLYTIPFMCLSQKSSYRSGLVSLVLALAAATVIVVLAKAASQAMQHGNTGFDKARERKDAINSIIQ